MNIRLEFKRYVVVQLLLPDLSKFGFMQDVDSLEEALRIADRSKGQLVFEVPKDARMPDGAVFKLDSDQIMQRQKIMGMKS